MGGESSISLLSHLGKGGEEGIGKANKDRKDQRVDPAARLLYKLSS
jgi:hypothetical protein